jgi:hypothetical protein
MYRLVAIFPCLIGSEGGYALNDPEHRHGADGVGPHKLENG